MLILMPSSQRAEMCNSLTYKLKDAKIYVFVNNCNFVHYDKLVWADNVTLVNFTDIKGCPKMCHNLTFRRMIDIETTDFLILEDDVDVNDSFISDFSGKISLLSSENFSLSPIYIKEKKCAYTPINEVVFTIGESTFLKQRYVDGNFYVTKNAHAVMKRALKNDVPVLKSSSGIGKAVSMAFYRNGINMYCTIPTMVGHGEHESIQFKEGRKKVPLIARL